MNTPITKTASFFILAILLGCNCYCLAEDLVPLPAPNSSVVSSDAPPLTNVGDPSALGSVDDSSLLTQMSTDDVALDEGASPEPGVCNGGTDELPFPSDDSLKGTVTALTDGLKKSTQSGWDMLKPLAGNPKITLFTFGEIHSAPPPYSAVMKFLLKEGDILFLELADKFQPAIDKYMNGDMTYDDLLAFKVIVPAATPLDDPQTLTLKTMVHNESGPAIRYAKENKMKVVAADIISNSMTERDKAMSDKIKTALKDHKGRAVFFVGMSHLTDRAYFCAAAKPALELGMLGLLEAGGLKPESIANITVYPTTFSLDLVTLLDGAAKPLVSFSFEKYSGKTMSIDPKSVLPATHTAGGRVAYLEFVGSSHASSNTIIVGALDAPIAK